MQQINVEVLELEVGPRHITIWGHPLDQLKNLGSRVWSQLPEDLQQINDQELSFHAVPIFHPLGEPQEVGRAKPRHIHIIYRSAPGQDEVNDLITILRRSAGKTQGMLITKVTDKRRPGMTDLEIDDAIQRSITLAESVIQRKLLNT